MENQEGQPDKVIKTIAQNINRWESEEYALHNSGKITHQSILPEGGASAPNELTEEQLQGLNFDWERERVRKTADYKEPIRPYFTYNAKGFEPVKKGAAQTALHTIAEFGKKIVPAKLKDGK
jgi:hypothetical protein